MGQERAMVTVEKIDNSEGFKHLHETWCQLLDRIGDPCIYLTHEWLYSWWTVYGDDKELYILAVKDGQNIIGIAPLMLTVSRSGISKRKKLEFIGSPNADYADFICTDGSLFFKNIFEYFETHPRDWDYIELSQISECSRSIGELEKMIGGSGRPYIKDHIETCYRYVYDGSEENRPEFSLRRNSTQRNSCNFFKKNGDLVFERVTDPVAIEKTLPQFFHLHIKRWKDTSYPSKFNEEKHRRFFYELVRTLGPAGNIFFFVLRVGDIPIALFFNFRSGKVIHLYTIAINLLFANKSPGILLLLEETENLIREKYELDFARGDHEYKMQISNSKYVNYQYVIYKRRLDYLEVRAYRYAKTIRPIKKILTNEKFKDAKAKFLLKLHNDGMGALIWTALKKGLSPIISYRAFIFVTHNWKEEYAFKPHIEVEIRKLDINDLWKIATFYGARMGSDTYNRLQDRLNRKDDCYVAFHNGMIVSITWGLHHSDPYPEAGLIVTPGENEVVASGGETSPVYRGFAIRPYLWTCALREYKDKGIKTIGAIEKTNKAQLRSQLKLKSTIYLHTARKLSLIGRWVI